MLYTHRAITNNFFITELDADFAKQYDAATSINFGLHNSYGNYYFYSLVCSIANCEQIIKDFKELILPKLKNIEIINMENSKADIIPYNNQFNIWFDLTEEELLYWKMKYED